MNPIKEFFKKKKNQLKKSDGRRLGDSTHDSRNQPKASSSYVVPARCQPSEGAQRAGAAALARVEQKPQPSTVNWSHVATKAHARKELELEKSTKIKDGPKEVVQESCPMLSVSGVYFTCPIIGPDILPLKEIREKIKEFLYEQLEQERGLTACLIIHTCNKNKEMVTNCVETLAKYLTNIIDNPTELKFRKIRVKNKVFQERVAGMEGAFEFLTAAGFSLQTENTGEIQEYFVFVEEDLDIENLQMLKEALLSAEPIVPVLDRNMKVLWPLQVVGDVCLPDDFFRLSVSEVQREQEARTEAVELGKVLRTKAMRERDEIKEFHRYKFTLIRIRFDEIILQGTFHVNEKLSAIKDFVLENIEYPDREFQLAIPGSDKKLTEDNLSLLDLKLVPAAILIFHQKKNHPSEEFLKKDVLLLLENERPIC